MKRSTRTDSPIEVQQPADPRRKVLKALVAGSAVTTSPIWVKPVVNSVLLPAHAQTSTTPGDAGAGGGADGGGGDDVTLLPAASASATPDEGVTVVINDAEAGESVVVTAVVAGREASVTVKADDAGRAAATISREAIKAAAGRDLNAGETIQIKARALRSGKTASIALKVKAAVSVPLELTLEANADTGTAVVTVAKAKANELVSAQLVVADRDIVVSGKASAQGVAKMEVSRDAIAAAGAKLVRGASVSVTAKSASGARGAATAIVTGRAVEPAALKFDGATGSMATGITLALSGARGSELVTLDLRSGEKSLSLKMKTAENGALKTAIAIAELKELELRGGSEVAITAVTDSGLRASTSLTMAAAAGTRPVTNTQVINTTTPVTNRPVVNGNRGR